MHDSDADRSVMHDRGTDRSVSVTVMISSILGSSG